MQSWSDLESGRRGNTPSLTTDERFRAQLAPRRPKLTPRRPQTDPQEVFQFVFLIGANPGGMSNFLAVSLCREAATGDGE